MDRVKFFLMKETLLTLFVSIFEQQHKKDRMKIQNTSKIDILMDSNEKYCTVKGKNGVYFNIQSSNVAKFQLAV